MRTTVVHVKDGCDVYIGRPSKWGNPFIKGEYGDHAACVKAHAEWIYEQPELMSAIPIELKGKKLGCWCKGKFKTCHGDILAWIADSADMFD